MAILSGLFLYLAYNALNSTQFYARLKLFVSEKEAYPAYTKEVPKSVLHGFTFLQLVQVIILSFFGFAIWPQVRMFFPLIVFLFFVLRQKVLPEIFEVEHLNVLDEETEGLTVEKQKAFTGITDMTQAITHVNESFQS